MNCNEAMKIARDIFDDTERRLPDCWCRRDLPAIRRISGVRRILYRIEDVAMFGGATEDWVRRRLRTAAGAMARLS